MKFLASSDYPKLIPSTRVVIYSPKKSTLLKKARVIAKITDTKRVLMPPVVRDDLPYYDLYIHTIKTSWIPASMVLKIL